MHLGCSSMNSRWSLLRVTVNSQRGSLQLGEKSRGWKWRCRTMPSMFRGAVQRKRTHSFSPGDVLSWRTAGIGILACEGLVVLRQDFQASRFVRVSLPKRVTLGGQFWAKSKKELPPHPTFWTWCCRQANMHWHKPSFVSTALWLFDRFTSCIVNASWSGAKKTDSLFFHLGMCCLDSPNWNHNHRQCHVWIVKAWTTRLKLHSKCCALLSTEGFFARWTAVCALCTSQWRNEGMQRSKGWTREPDQTKQKQNTSKTKHNQKKQNNTKPLQRVKRVRRSSHRTGETWATRPTS